MTIYSQINGTGVQSTARALLATLKDTLLALQDEQTRLAAFADADLVTAGIPAADLPFLRNAIADGNGLASIFLTGTDPRNPPPPYIYYNSVKQILGP